MARIFFSLALFALIRQYFQPFKSHNHNLISSLCLIFSGSEIETASIQMCKEYRVFKSDLPDTRVLNLSHFVWCITHLEAHTHHIAASYGNTPIRQGSICVVKMFKFMFILHASMVKYSKQLTIFQNTGFVPEHRNSHASTSFVSY